MRQKTNGLQDFMIEFFQDSENNISQIMNIVVDDILNFDNVDENKFAVAMASLSAAKKAGELYGYFDLNQLFDITKESDESHNYSKIYLKGFISKNNPNLFLFKENESLPFYKIKASNNNGKTIINVKTSNNEKLISGTKKIDNDSAYYLIKDSFVLSENILLEDKLMKLKTDKASSENSVDLANIGSDYFKLFEVIKNMIEHQKNGLKLSDSSVNVIILNFYKVVESLLSSQYDFSFDELLTILDCVINDNYLDEKSFDGECSIENLTNKICGLQPSLQIAPTVKEFKIADNERNIDKVKVVRSDKFANIEVFDKQNKNRCQIMICLTNKSGFTIYRTVNNGKVIDYSKLPSFTINLTDDIFRIVAMSDGKSAYGSSSPLEIILKINEDGSVEYSSENKVLDFIKGLDDESMTEHKQRKLSD